MGATVEIGASVRKRAVGDAVVGEDVGDRDVGTDAVRVDNVRGGADRRDFAV